MTFLLTRSCQIHINFFDDDQEIRSVLLGISKAFDRVRVLFWQGSCFQIKAKIVYGNLLSALADFVKLRKQRVVLWFWSTFAHVTYFM